MDAAGQPDEKSNGKKEKRGFFRSIKDGILNVVSSEHRRKSLRPPNIDGLVMNTAGKEEDDGGMDFGGDREESKSSPSNA